MNEYQKVSCFICGNTHHFSSSHPPTLIDFLVWFVCLTKMADSDWSDHMSIKLPVKVQLLYISTFLFGLSMYFMILKKIKKIKQQNIKVCSILYH